MPLSKSSRTPLEIRKVSEETVEKFKSDQWRAIGMQYGMPLWYEEIANFAAFRGSKLLGVMTATSRGAVAEMRQIIVHDEHRHEGIGTQFMDVFTEFARENHCFRMILKIPEVYKDPINFYKKHGFKLDAKLRDYEFHRDWFWMSKKVI